jgi:hypothetical protein
MGSGDWRKFPEQKFKPMMIITDVRDNADKPAILYQGFSHMSQKLNGVCQMMNDSAGDDEIHRRIENRKAVVEIPDLYAGCVKFIEIENFLRDF